MNAVNRIASPISELKMGFHGVKSLICVIAILLRPVIVTEACEGLAWLGKVLGASVGM